MICIYKFSYFKQDFTNEILSCALVNFATSKSSKLAECQCQRNHKKKKYLYISYLNLAYI